MGPFGLKLFAGPAAEPVSVFDAKLRLHVTTDDEDADIGYLITEARAAAEAECGRAFITQTWNLYLDDFPRGSREIRIPRPPLQSVTHVKYYDTEGVQQTWGSANYVVAANREPGRIVLASSSSWPAVQPHRPEAVEVRFVAGYGAAGSNCPAEVLAAIKLILTDRKEDPAGTGKGIPDAARRLLNMLEYGEVR